MLICMMHADRINMEEKPQKGEVISIPKVCLSMFILGLESFNQCGIGREKVWLDLLPVPFSHTSNI